MAHENVTARREAVARVIEAGLSIGGPEAKLLAVLYGCSPTAIKTDAKTLQGTVKRSSGPEHDHGSQH